MNSINKLSSYAHLSCLLMKLVCFRLENSTVMGNTESSPNWWWQCHSNSNNPMG